MLGLVTEVSTVHRAFAAVPLFVLTTCILLGPTPASAAENPQLHALVYNDAQVSPETLTGAEQRAAEIFSQAGFDVNWVNCTHLDSDSEASGCNVVEGPGNLVLRIISHVASSTSDVAFGVAFLGLDGTGRYSDVFWNRAQELHTNSNVDIAGILGSVIAHEMGHLLLGSNAHAISGIMRAHWEAGELRRINMGTLVFLPQQGKRMRARIAQQKTLLMSSRESPGY
jgi:hypothetical protein